jgi:hypothetical protein
VSRSQPRRSRAPRRALALFALAVLAGPAAGRAEIAIGTPLRVRILFDNSGSMYPGYTPPGTPNRRTKSELGVRFFHEYPEFQAWLADFVARQTLLDGERIGMWTFTSFGAFTSGDIKQVHEEVPLDRFDVARAVSNFPRKPDGTPATGQTTYLTETIDQFLRGGFEGLVWLITDNIIETKAGEPVSDIERFFRVLKDDPRFHSVHLFKFPFRDPQAGSAQGAPALAVYGLLVSPSAPPDNVLAYYDRKFRERFRNAERNGGGQLFPGAEHLKLRNLEIDALELKMVPNLEVILADPKKGLFKEGQPVQLALSGEIKSHLTQHAVTNGRYHLAFTGKLEPQSVPKDLGLQPIAKEAFSSADGVLTETIPPNGATGVGAQLRSKQPISLRSPGFGTWLRLALQGAVVTYTGNVEMSFTDVRVRLEREQMAGIFGINQVPRIFDIQDVTEIKVDPSTAPVSFTLQTGGNRTLVLVGIVLLLLALLGIPLWLLFMTKQWCTVRISGTPDRQLALRRLGSHQIVHEGQPLGRLVRGLSGDFDFEPTAYSAALTVTPGREQDTWDVRFRDGQGCQLAIEPKGGRTKKKTPGPPVDFGERPGPSGPPGPTSGGAPGAPPSGYKPPTIDPP